MRYFFKNKPLLSPRYWPLWLLTGLFWCLVKLPYRLQLRLGTLLGAFLLCLGGKMCATAEKNLALCFPELTPAQRADLLKKNFASVGIAVFETAMAYWWPQRRLEPLVHFQGLAHIQAALAKGRGILIIGAHFSTLQLIGRLATTQYKAPFAVVYHPQKQRFFQALTQKMLKKYYWRAIPRGHLRSVLSCLKENAVVWYTPDVDSGGKNSVFAPFFGILAASTTATVHLAEWSSAAVLMSRYYRREDGSGYDIIIDAPLENFPSGDVKADITRINLLQEHIVRQKPEQYLWQYKRFKNRPPGQQRFY